MFYGAPMENERIFLQLGRLDARLASSIGRTSWQLAMRVRGIALACREAGMPVEDSEVRDWISGVTLPPRHLVGLEDPLRVPTAAFYYLRAMGAAPAQNGKDSAVVFGKMLDARGQAREWASDEVDFYDELFETLSDAASQLKLEPTVVSVSRGLSSLLELALRIDERGDLEIISELNGEADRLPIVWLVSVFTPFVLLRSGLTQNLMPQMIPSLFFLNMQQDLIEQALIEMLGTEICKGHSLLANFERSLSSVRDDLLTKRRSKTWDAALIVAAFPHIKRKLLGSVLNVRPQGAGYIKSRLADFDGRLCKGSGSV